MHCEGCKFITDCQLGNECVLNYINKKQTKEKPKKLKKIKKEKEV